MESEMSAVAESKPFRRSRTDRWSAGILGGLAEHLNLDPYLVRAAFVALAVFTVVLPCLVLYIALWVIIPESVDQATARRTRTTAARRSGQGPD